MSKLKILKEITSIWVVISIAIILIVVSLIIFLDTLRRPHYERAERILSNQYQYLRIVTDYLQELEHERIWIRNDFERGEISVGGASYSIYDEETLNAISRLFNNRIRIIGKYGNTIYFTRWAGRDFGRGLAFTIDGNPPVEEAIDFLTYYTPLSVPGWWYYEAMFNQWRVQQNRWW